MVQLSNLIIFVEDKLTQYRGKSGNEEARAVLHEIKHFLNFVDKSEWEPKIYFYLNYQNRKSEVKSWR